jgi:hypothetical protein
MLSELLSPSWQKHTKEAFRLMISKEVLWRMRLHCQMWTTSQHVTVAGIVFERKAETFVHAKALIAFVP